jgi:hypothetical protein
MIAPCFAYAHSESIPREVPCSSKKEGEACVNKSVNDAVARINAPRLTQYTESSGDKAGLVQLANAN